MTDRQLVAYALIVVLVAALAAIAWWRRYHSFPQVDARRQERQRQRSEARAAKLATHEDERP